MRGSADVTYKPTGFDRFGRTLAHVFAGDMNVGETLIEEGHALRYEKGGEAKAARLKVWCGPHAELPRHVLVEQMAAAQEKPKTESDVTVHYPNCAAARAAGATPIRVDELGYSRKLDRDGDGVACE